MSQSEALIPEVFNLTLTDADTEYSQVLSKGTKYFSLQCRTAFDMRVAFRTGFVATPTAPYATIKTGQVYNGPEKVGWSRTKVPQVDTVTIANTWAQNDTIQLVIGSSTVTVTIGTLTTTAQVATTLQQAWENLTLTDGSASVSPAEGGQLNIETSQITATVSGSVVTLTSGIAGQSFTLVVTETTAGDGTAVEAVATAASSEEATLYLASAQAAVVAEIIAWRDTR